LVQVTHEQNKFPLIKLLQIGTPHMSTDARIRLNIQSELIIEILSLELN